MWRNLKNLLEYLDPCRFFTTKLLYNHLTKSCQDFHYSEFDDGFKIIFLLFKFLLVVQF